MHYKSEYAMVKSGELSYDDLSYNEPEELIVVLDTEPEKEETFDDIPF